jgi:hypothetical protein
VRFAQQQTESIREHVVVERRTQGRRIIAPAVGLARDRTAAN